MVCSPHHHHNVYVYGVDVMEDVYEFIDDVIQFRVENVDVTLFFFIRSLDAGESRYQKARSIDPILSSQQKVNAKKAGEKIPIIFEIFEFLYVVQNVYSLSISRFWGLLPNVKAVIAYLTKLIRLLTSFQLFSVITVALIDKCSTDGAIKEIRGRSTLYIKHYQLQIKPQE